MSTDYKLREVNFDTLRENLSKMSLCELKIEETTEDCFVITEGINYLWVYREEDDNIFVSRYGVNDSDFILQKISEEFNATVVDEHQLEFYDEDEREEMELNKE